MKKKYLFPTLVIAGVAVYWFMTKKNTTTTTDTIAPGEPDYTENLQDGGTPLTPVVVTPPATNTTPAIVYQDVIATTPGLQTMSKEALVASLTPIIKTVYGYKNVDISYYTLNRLQFLYAIGNYIPYSNTQYWKAFNSMTERELGDSWNYVTTYLAKNKKLLFAENPALYNEITAIQTKYGIF